MNTPIPKPAQPTPRAISAPDNLKPWSNNPRSLNDKQLTKIVASMKRFGFTAPVLIDEAGVILSGHGRPRGCSPFRTASCSAAR